MKANTHTSIFWVISKQDKARPGHLQNKCLRKMEERKCLFIMSGKPIYVIAAFQQL